MKIYSNVNHNGIIRLHAESKSCNSGLGIVLRYGPFKLLQILFRWVMPIPWSSTPWMVGVGFPLNQKGTHVLHSTYHMTLLAN